MQHNQFFNIGKISMEEFKEYLT